jgi:hypothetical protein
MLSLRAMNSPTSRLRKPSFAAVANIEHTSSSGHVSANYSRPLFQTAETVIREYGWVVDYEDPPYFSTFDLTDDTDPRWRASHPNSKGVVRVAGSAFQSTFPEPVGETTKEQVLEKIISDYNSSGNPGKFALRKEGENRYAVIGVAVKDDAGKDKDAPVLLDTLITVPEAHRSAFDTLNLVLSTLSTFGCQRSCQYAVYERHQRARHRGRRQG